MVQKIALFNHKGGVSKTTITFNLGWMLAAKGKRVILADTDPQCNLTDMILGQGKDSSEERIASIYSQYSNIKSGLRPAFEFQPRAITPIDCIAVERQEGLFLIPGHVGLAEYEVTLGIAQELSSSIQTLKNLPGSLTDLLNKTADKFSADYILIDMSPSLNPINQNLLMTSDFFLVPTTADFFSVMAIDSLSKILPRWHSWASQMSALRIFKEASYPFPEINPRFLGVTLQNHNAFRAKDISSLENVIQRIESEVLNSLIPTLRANNMLLPEDTYRENHVSQSFLLTQIPSFGGLIALSQEHQTPVFALTPAQLRSSRWDILISDKAQDKQEEFRNLFSDLADQVIGLTSEQYAVSP